MKRAGLIASPFFLNQFKMIRSLRVDTAAADPVFTTAQAKEFLKVDVSTDDTLIDN